MLRESLKNMWISLSCAVFSLVELRNTYDILRCYRFGYFYDVCSVKVRAVTSTSTSVWFVSSLFSNAYYTETIIIQQLIPLPTFI